MSLRVVATCKVLSLSIFGKKGYRIWGNLHPPPPPPLPSAYLTNSPKLKDLNIVCVHPVPLQHVPPLGVWTDARGQITAKRWNYYNRNKSTRQSILKLIWLLEIIFILEYFLSIRQQKPVQVLSSIYPFLMETIWKPTWLLCL